MEQENYYRNCYGEVMFVEATAAKYDIDPYLLGVVFRYLNDHLNPGGFLRSVLAGDLFSAVALANENSRNSIVGLTEFILHNVDRSACGSHAMVKAWTKPSA